MKKTEDELIEDMLNTAFSEDIGDGDHTTLCCIPDTAMGKAKLLVKEDGVLAEQRFLRFHRHKPLKVLQ